MAEKRSREGHLIRKKEEEEARPKVAEKERQKLGPEEMESRQNGGLAVQPGDFGLMPQAAATTTTTTTSNDSASLAAGFGHHLANPIESTRETFAWLSSLQDPKVEHLPLMASPWPVLAIFVAYLLVANQGPKLMANRKALKLRLALIVYNLALAGVNLWIAFELTYCAYKLNYSSLCLLVPSGQTIPLDHERRIANGVWCYFASKGIEFLDTLFFILRKKDRQLTFLHKYHHSSMFLVWWTAARFVPGGSVIVPIVINSLVHVLMYAYYALAAIGPQMQKYLWWKRHLTMIQLVQFFIGIAIGIRLVTTQCQFTPWMQYVFSAYTFSFIILFGNFYLNEYINKKRSLEATAAANIRADKLKQKSA